MIHLSLSLTKSLSYTIIWVVFVIPSCVLSVDKSHQNCSIGSRCGNQTLYYPFWTPDKEECGHPDFKVSCSGDFAEFSISSVKFRILEMNIRFVRLARMDYLNNLCPHDPENASINQDVLPFSNDTELLTFFYNCPSPRLDFPPGDYIRQLQCGADIDEKSYFVRKELSSSHELVGSISNVFRSSCKRTLDIPVSRSALKTAERNQNLEAMEAIMKAVDKGFELRFNSDCSRCLTSQGACGYNHHSREFVCYCINEPHKHTCEKGLSKKAKIGIGFACGFLGATLLAGCVFCFYTRRRKKLAAQYTSKGLSTTSPYSSNNTMSNTPSSTKISGSNHSLVPSMSNLANGSVYYGVQVFSYEELEEATENFSKELGDGGFGTVYYGTLKDGRAVAVKRLFERSLKRVEQFKNEIDILKSLKHPNLVILYGCTTRHSRELLLVYEYISNGTLAEHLHGNQAQSHPLCWPSRLKIAIETASALSYLHASGNTN